MSFHFSLVSSTGLGPDGHNGKHPTVPEMTSQSSPVPILYSHGFVPPPKKKLSNDFLKTFPECSILIMQ